MASSAAFWIVNSGRVRTLRKWSTLASAGEAGVVGARGVTPSATYWGLDVCTLGSCRGPGLHRSGHRILTPGGGMTHALALKRTARAFPVRWSPGKTHGRLRSAGVTLVLPCQPPTI